jgi:DNA replication and repair protein RecF
MAMLDSLFIQSLRNLNEITLEPGQHNVLFGHNGSGKTSILEAVYMLATGRSFRAHHQHVIKLGSPCLYLRGTVLQEINGQPVKIALQKSRNNQHIIKVAGQPVDSITQIAKYLPVQVLHLLNYQMLQSAPEERRKLIDWAVFHVEHSFLESWRSFNQLLKQRNAALRQQNQPQEVWEEQLALVGTDIHRLRQRVCESWLVYAQQMIVEFLGLPGIELVYYPGWDTTLSLKETFAHHLSRDLSLGYTYNGPQRADLQIKYQGKLAQHVLSQGQQKRLVTALQLSQIAWVYTQTATQGILLIDDLPAELDFSAQEQIMAVLKQLNMQVFLTCVEESIARRLAHMLDAKLFHVEHGVVRNVV